jgi:hypothetical protein
MTTPGWRTGGGGGGGTLGLRTPGSPVNYRKVTPLERTP